MNILILNWRDPKHPNAGGAEKVTLEHAKGWISKGHSVTWFSSYFNKAKREEFIDQVQIIRKGSCVGGVHLSAFFWYIFGNHQNYDLVVDQFHGIPFFTPLYVKVKKLAFIHEVARDVWWLNEWKWPFNKIVGFLGYYLEPFIFKFFYRNIAFMTVSESTRKDLINCGIPSKNITVINNGLNLDEIPKKLPPKEKRKTAIFLGAISYDKGIFDALEAFGEINIRDANWQFWIVGRASPEMKDNLKKRIKVLNIGKNTTYFGYVNDHKKFDLLSRAHVMVNPSVREGWGLVNIEAAAAGTPVVAYSVSGCSDSIVNGKSGVLVDIKDRKNLWKYIMSLVSDKNYEKMVKFCLLFSRRYSWEDAKKKSLSLIEKIYAQK
ncbi:MAG: glycosyltransferase family 4 protein [Patescibacteria group bacterium]|nr:glycosyltransferase family 4 protein [Patescibacteria group bacterium]